MKETASFYNTKVWQRCREGYKKSVGYLCEDCMKKGLCNPGEIVHHKIHINPTNMNDASITLNWDNLVLLCRDCHGKQHGSEKRYKVDEMGHVQIK